jgi:hypothetical protein
MHIIRFFDQPQPSSVAHDAPHFLRLQKLNSIAKQNSD